MNQHPAVRYEIYFVSKKCDLIISRASLKGVRSVKVIMWQLTGQKLEDKLDPGSRYTTVKRLASYYSTPTVIEDNASKKRPSLYLLDSI